MGSGCVVSEALLEYLLRPSSEERAGPVAPSRLPGTLAQTQVHAVLPWHSPGDTALQMGEGNGMLAKNGLTHPLNGSACKSLCHFKPVFPYQRRCCKVLENNAGCCELRCPINEGHDSQLPFHSLIVPSNQPGSIPSISIDSRYQI